MHKPDYAVVKNVLVVGALVLASLPVSAQRISADTVKNGHFPGALRGHFDAHPNKSFHHLSTGGPAAAAHSKHGNPPQPIVSSFFRKSSRSGSSTMALSSDPIHSLTMRATRTPQSKLSSFPS